MTDRDLQQDVQNALECAPGIGAAGIGVSSVDEGVVTLRADVSSYTQKSTAERVALGVYGVKAVANDVVVRPADALQRTDTDIAAACDAKRSPPRSCRSLPPPDVRLLALMPRLRHRARTRPAAN